MRKRRIKNETYLEESISDSWVGDMDIVEVPLNEKPLFYVGIALFLVVLLVVGRVLYLGVWQGSFYKERAEINLGRYTRTTPPRGVIIDRYGKVIAENKPVFSALLDVREFLHQTDLQAETIQNIQKYLNISEDEVWKLVKDKDLEKDPDPVVLVSDLDQSQVVALKGLNIPTLEVEDTFSRDYPDGQVYSSVVGYVGLASPKDIRNDPSLSGQDLVGKAGLELYYDDALRGTPGIDVKLTDAKGRLLSEQEKTPPQIGKTLNLTIDADLQKYFYDRMQQGLDSLNRTGGAGLAMDPRTGEILALINFPVYDNNVFITSGHNTERQELLTSSARPLFDRTVAGLYSPGSTIKPLVGVAALKEGVISPDKQIYSPGYLDVPNPYDPSKPSRFLDWRPQGWVDLGAAIAQSSDVYFYEVGGGFGDQKGLGLDKLNQWWTKFGLGSPTGVDLPGESKGFLPTKDWKQKAAGRGWYLGDTYNVSIGQGDLQITPLALLNYISAVANGGTLYKPHVAKSDPERLSDLTYLGPQIKLVQEGMRETVTSKLGTAFVMNDLPFEVAGKTGSAQINNNTKENAFFVGYAPYKDPQIAILILVENSREGSLNAVPIAKDVLNWYYQHRLK